MNGKTCDFCDSTENIAKVVFENDKGVVINFVMCPVCKERLTKQWEHKYHIKVIV